MGRLHTETEFGEEGDLVFKVSVLTQCVAEFLSLMCS